MTLSSPKTESAVATKLLNVGQGEPLSPPPSPHRGSGLVSKPMNRESQARFIAVLLFLLTVASVVFAGFNFEAERKATSPTDSVLWTEKNGHLTADQIQAGGPGEK